MVTIIRMRQNVSWIAGKPHNLQRNRICDLEGYPVKYVYENRGTCSRQTIVELEDGIRLSYEDFLNNPMRAER